MPRELVSVCVPVFNAERYLAASLESILAQTHPLTEVLILDDSSTDDSPRIAAEFAARDSRVRVIRSNPSTGRAFAALNWAIRQTSGEFVAVYHADDVYDPTIVEREAAYLAENPGSAAVFCLPRFLDQNGSVTGEARLPSELAGLRTIDCRAVTETMLRHKNVFLAAPSAMLRRKIFDLVGGFDQEGYGVQADGEMWLRMVRVAPIGLLDEHLLGYRCHPGQWSRRAHDLRTTREPYFRMMDYHLSQPGVREQVSAEALTFHRVWEAKDETERAANALVLGDRVLAQAILRASLVRPLLRSPARGKVARFLVLKALVYAASAAGGGKLMRKAVYTARFRRRMPPDLKPSSESMWWLDPPGVGKGDQPGAQTVPRRQLRVFLDPFSYHFLGNGLFDVQSKWNRDGSLRPWLVLRSHLRQHGFTLDTADYLSKKAFANRINIYTSFGIHDRQQRLVERRDVILNAFYLFETVMYAPRMYEMLPQLSTRFRTVYSWTDAKTLARFATGPFRVSSFRVPAPFSDVIDRFWSRSDREGVMLVCTNRRGIAIDGDLFDERLRATEHFAARGDFELWGRGWDDVSGLSPRFAAAVGKSWRGPLADKYEAYSRARFVVCYENQILRGWITEKIFDCFRSGAVPLYLGAPDVLDWIPADCFVDVRKFSGYDDLSRYLDTLSPDDLLRYRVAARDYLASEAFRPFSAEAFADRFLADVYAQLDEHGLARPRV
jgi:Glycosyltransferases involved in cell wall biogenesis